MGKCSKHRREAKNEIEEIPMKIRLQQMKKVKQKRLAASLIREMKSRLLPLPRRHRSYFNASQIRHEKVVTIRNTKDPSYIPVSRLNPQNNG